MADLLRWQSPQVLVTINRYPYKSIFEPIQVDVLHCILVMYSRPLCPHLRTINAHRCAVRNLHSTNLALFSNCSKNPHHFFRSHQHGYDLRLKPEFDEIFVVEIILLKLHVEANTSLLLLTIELKILVKTFAKLLPHVVCLDEEGSYLLMEDLFLLPVFLAGKKLFFNFSFQSFFEWLLLLFGFSLFSKDLWSDFLEFANVVLDVVFLFFQEFFFFGSELLFGCWGS